EIGQGHLYIGVRGGTAKSLDEDTGSTIFETDYPVHYNDIDTRSAPSITVAFGVLLVSTSESTNAYDADSGAFIWSNSIGGPLFWGYNYPQFYVPFGNSSIFCTPSETSINVKNGQELWQIKDAQNIPLVFSGPPPVFSGDRGILWNNRNPQSIKNFFITSPTSIVCFNSTSGGILWGFSIGAQTYQPTITNDSVYVGSQDGNLYAFNLTNGNLEWKEFVDYQHLSGNFSEATKQTSVALDGSQPIFDNGRIFYNAALNSSQSGYNGSVVCLNAEKGEKLWSLPLYGNNTTSSPTSLTLYNGTLYATQKGDLYLINEYKGIIELKRSFDHYILTPIVSNNAVFVAADLNIYPYKTK
ncbi:MAG TPA: PQQ-binding-like beta-propeller repeat protein, partial [Candidatus Binatia bacterium]|nr:PQQ-binding-like beta-propeller repeat protein [Candidatus Binatia bacterium]